ncbi:GNAT family N-acetyltransferase [Dehalococcoidia bacterium]|nr:GNAT family N-acetyltransferase [Dehalococcoidia bacterium]
MLVRKAKIKDLPRVTELAVALLKYHENLDPYFTAAKDVEAVYLKFFKTCIYSPKRLLLVVEENSEIVGYALGESASRPPVFKIRRIGVINDMFVVEKLRKCGIAKIFLEQLFIWFRSKQLDYVQLGVHVRNQTGKKAWAKYGFEDFMSTQRAEIGMVGTRLR